MLRPHIRASVVQIWSRNKFGTVITATRLAISRMRGLSIQCEQRIINISSPVPEDAPTVAQRAAVRDANLPSTHLNSAEPGFLLLDQTAPCKWLQMHVEDLSSERRQSSPRSLPSDVLEVKSGLYKAFYSFRLWIKQLCFQLASNLHVPIHFITFITCKYGSHCKAKASRVDQLT